VRCPGARTIEVALSTTAIMRYPAPHGRARITPPILLGAARATIITVRALDKDGAITAAPDFTAGGRYLSKRAGYNLYTGNHQPLVFPFPDPRHEGRTVRYEDGKLTLSALPPPEPE